MTMHSTKPLSAAVFAAALALSATLASAQVEPVAPPAPSAIPALPAIPAVPAVEGVPAAPAIPAVPAAPAAPKAPVRVTVRYAYSQSATPAVYVRTSSASSFSSSSSPEPTPAPPEPPEGAFEGQPGGAMGQTSEPRVKDDLFEGTEVFAKNATDVTEINMDPSSLDMVNNRRSAHSMVLNVVRTYTYDKPGLYDMAEVEKFRAKLNTGDWSCSVHTRNFKTGSSSDVCNKRRSDGMRENAIITVEPRSLTFIHNIRRQNGEGGSSEMSLPSGLVSMGPMIAMVDGERLAGLDGQLARLNNLDGLDVRLDNLDVQVDAERMAQRMADSQKRMAEAQTRMAEASSRINSSEFKEQMERMQIDMQRFNSFEFKSKEKDEKLKEEKLKDKQENEQRDQSRI